MYDKTRYGYKAPAIPGTVAGLLEAHEKFAHANFKVVRNILGLKASKVNPSCASCTIAKQKRRPAARVFHEVDLNIPQTERSTKKTQVDALAVRQGAIDAGKEKGLLSSKSMQKLLGEPMVVAPAVLLFLVAIWLLLLR